MGWGVDGSERKLGGANSAALSPPPPKSPNRTVAHWSSGKSQGKYFDHSESEIDPVVCYSVRCNILGLFLAVFWWWEVEPTGLDTISSPWGGNEQC